MRVLLEPKWIAGHVLVVVLVVLFVNLGFWQLRRHDERAARNAAIAAGLEQDPRPLPELPEGDRAYRWTELRGTYLPEAEALLTPRTEHGPGHHVLTPMTLPDDRVVVVDRGWVPFAMDTPPLDGAAPPAGPVTVTGVLLPATEVDPRAVRDTDSGRLLRMAAVDPGTVVRGPHVVEDVFLLLREQVPPPGRLPIPAPLPEPQAGPHLSYAAQWLIFAGVGVLGYPLLLRRTIRERATTQ